MDVEQVTSRDGTPIAIRRSGSGEPLLLVHGGATSSADWWFLVPRLRERFTVVTMDRRGRGGSGDAPEHSMEREGEDVRAVLEHVGAELCVAHSYGALCAIRAVQDGARLRRLVLYEPPVGAKRHHLTAVEAHLAAGDPDAATAAFVSAVGVPEDQLSAVRSSPGWRHLVDAIPTIPRELLAIEAWRHPPEPITVPTLFLTGGETTSGMYLDGLDELLAAFADLRRETIPGQQHAAHVFAADECARLVIDFCGG